MYILVPDDPVFFARFQSLEEPLLRRLHQLHVEGLESDDERIVSDAYDSWVRVLLKLPLWPQGHTEAVSPGSAVPERLRYALYGVRGGQLTSLWPIDVHPADLGQLAACVALFLDGDQALMDAFRRVMEVLSLSPPQGLLGALRDAVAQGPVVSVALSAEQETEYRRFCEEIVSILSSGDTFAFRSHRAMYL